MRALQIVVVAVVPSKTMSDSTEKKVRLEEEQSSEVDEGDQEAPKVAPTNTAYVEISSVK